MNPTSASASDGNGTRDAFEARLQALARRELGGPATALRRLTGGASQQMWAFDVGDRGYVLRHLPEGTPADRLDTVGPETEAAVIGAVQANGVPVATVSCVMGAGDGLGRGFVAVRMGGEALGHRIVRSSDFADTRPRLAAECGRILAGIHATPSSVLPMLSSVTPSRSIDQLEGQLRGFDEPRPVFEAALTWLRDRCPAPVPDRLVHGDFRNGNFLIEPGGVAAVLDWEACHLGDPCEDLGWLCMPVWRFGRADLPVGGFGIREDLFDAYASAAGRPVDAARVAWWEVRGMLRWGLTCMFMADAFARGERSIERAAVGRRASEAEIELLHAIIPREAH